MSDYAHARHAGNVGDVLKHVALLAVLRHRVSAGAPALRYVESHAGGGLFPLGSTGEWSAGIQRLWQAPPGAFAPVVDDYVALARRWSPPGAERPVRFPGSPLIAQAALRPGDRMLLHEREPTVADELRAALGSDARAEVRTADGLAGLPGALVDGAVALIDPHYAQKSEWTDTAAAAIAARRQVPGAALLIWYPIKALTRPRLLLSALVEGGLHGTLVELISTPLRLKRDKLSGSGLALIGVPDPVVAELCGALVRLGPALMTHGEWSAQQIGF